MLDFMSSLPFHVLSILFVQMLTSGYILSFEHGNCSGETACVYFSAYPYLVVLCHTVSAYLGLPLI